MKDSIKADELKKRVEKYDYHMEIMHPNQSKNGCDSARLYAVHPYYNNLQFTRKRMVMHAALFFHN